MATKTLDLKQVLQHILGCNFVVDQGTSGIWNYRKWSDGTAECWGAYSATITAYASGVFGSGYGFQAAVNFPTGLFVNAVPIVSYTAKVGNNFALTGTLTDAFSVNTVTVYAVSTIGGSQVTVWHIMAKGRWK